MQEIVNEIVIDADADVVFKCCMDVHRWPSIFDTCKEVKCERLGDNDVKMKMTVENDLGVNTIVSHRRYNVPDRRIDFDLITTPRQISVMKGYWKVSEGNDGAELKIVHFFDVNKKTADETGRDNDEYLEGVSKAIYTNTESALYSVRKWISDNK